MKSWIKENLWTVLAVAGAIALFGGIVWAEIERLDFIKDCLELKGQYIKVDGAWVCAKLDVLKTYR